MGVPAGQPDPPSAGRDDRQGRAFEVRLGNAFALWCSLPVWLLPSLFHPAFYGSLLSLCCAAGTGAGPLPVRLLLMAMLRRSLAGGSLLALRARWRCQAAVLWAAESCGRPLAAVLVAVRPWAISQGVGLQGREALVLPLCGGAGMLLDPLALAPGAGGLRCGDPAGAAVLVRAAAILGRCGLGRSLLAMPSGRAGGPPARRLSCGRLTGWRSCGAASGGGAGRCPGRGRLVRASACKAGKP